MIAETWTELYANQTVKTESPRKKSDTDILDKTRIDLEDYLRAKDSDLLIEGRKQELRTRT